MPAAARLGDLWRRAVVAPSRLWRGGVGVGRRDWFAPGGAGVIVAMASLLSGCGPERPGAPEPFECLTSFGDVGISPGQFSYPRGLDSDSRTLWTIDKSARVQRIDPATGQNLGGWRMPEWDLGKPTGIAAWEPAGADRVLVFIADTHYHRIMMYAVAADPQAAIAAGPGGHLSESELARLAPAHAGPQIGTFLGKFGSYGEGDGQFIYPTDVAVMPTPDGKRIARLFVGEYGGHDRISIWEPQDPGQDPLGPGGFKFVRAFGAFGSSGDGATVEFSRPQSLAFDASRQELVLTDSCNHRIGRFSVEGELIAWIGGPQLAGAEPGRMSYPYGLTLVGDGTAVVAEFGSSRIQRFDLRSGVSVGSYGRPGRGRGEVLTPWGVTMLGDRLYILDSSNNRIQSMRLPRARPIPAARPDVASSPEAEMVEPRASGSGGPS